MNLFAKMVYMPKQSQKSLPKISSLAAPTDDDLAAMRSLSEEDLAQIVGEHIEQGARDIAEGRSTTLSSEEDIRKFFDKVWSIE